MGDLDDARRALEACIDLIKIGEHSDSLSVHANGIYFATHALVRDHGPIILQALSKRDGFVLVPKEILVEADNWSAATFVVGSREDGFNDAVLFVGYASTDNATEHYGLHVRSADYPEEGCVTLAMFPAAPEATWQPIA